MQIVESTIDFQNITNRAKAVLVELDEESLRVRADNAVFRAFLASAEG